MSVRSANFSPDEIEILISCVESKPQLAHGGFGEGIKNKDEARSAWEAIAKKINKVALGAVRTGPQVKTKWHDFKYRLRRKAAKIAADGDTTTFAEKFTSAELRVLSLIGYSRRETVKENSLSKKVEHNTENSSADNQINHESSVLVKKVEYSRLESAVRTLSRSTSLVENVQTDNLSSSPIKKEVEYDKYTTSSTTLLQTNEEGNGAVYAMLVPVQLPSSEHGNGQTDSTMQSFPVISVQSALSQQENGINEGIVIQNNPVLPVQSRECGNENGENEEITIQYTPALSGQSRFSEQESGEGTDDQDTTSALCEQNKENTGKTCPQIIHIQSKSARHEEVTSDDWYPDVSVKKRSAATERSQKHRWRKRKLREAEERALEKKVVDTQTDMANELKKISSHLGTIANTNLEIVKVLKNIEMKQDTVISYLSVALNSDDMYK